MTASFTTSPRWQRFRAAGGLASVAIAAIFWIAASCIVLLREQVAPYRPGQSVPNDIVARVGFIYTDRDLLTRAKSAAWEQQPRVYKTNGDAWTAVEESLLALPDQTAGLTLEQLPLSLRSILDSGTVTALQQYAAVPGRLSYNASVRAYIHSLRDQDWIILDDAQRRDDLKNRSIVVPGRGSIRTESTLALGDDELRRRLSDKTSASFVLALQPKIVALTLARLQPTLVVDDAATAEAKNLAADRIPLAAAAVPYKANMVLVPRGVVSEQDWQLLRAENNQFISMEQGQWLSRAGLVGLVGVVTLVLAIYIARYQPRVIRNHARASAIAALLLATLLLAQLAAIGSSPLHVFGLAPTLLAAMILAIAYDQRFALGVASLHGTLVTVGLSQGITFFLILFVGVMCCCFLLDDIRTRSKLIEVGGATALVMMAVSAAAGAVGFDPPDVILKNCAFAGAAALAVAFIVLGILPFIEKTFRITTSMTLLELADASQPLLRRLAQEAPGTYNHSLQVATLAEAAGEELRCNSLLCRVGSLYHDVGKINKADYFIENQGGGENLHLNLSPTVSIQIIIGHVKDGVELAKQYNLPTRLFPFIQQHHGTTLVEYFYNQACREESRSGQPAVVDQTEYRYPGPRPRSKETAIVMIADAVESACRSITAPTVDRIESLVHDLIYRRLADHQFDDCELTFRDLELIEQSMMKSLAGIYHGRIAYPPAPTASAAAPATVITPTARSA